MRIGILTEENTNALAKRGSQQQNNKHYKGYNHNNNSNKIQQQNQQQQQEISCTLPKVKQINANNNTNIIDSYQNNNEEQGSYTTVTPNIAKTSHKETNYLSVCSNSKNNKSSCSSNSSSRNSSPILTITNKNINITLNTKISTQSSFQQSHHLPNAFQQQQHYYYSTDICLNTNQNLLTKSDTGGSIMIDSPVASAIYSATWKTRNTGIVTTTPTFHNSNDDNNNINGSSENSKSCCQSSLETSATSIAKGGGATLLSPRNPCNSLTIPTTDLQKRQQQHQSNLLLSNAKAPSVEQNSPKSRLLATTIAASNTSSYRDKIQQEKERQQLQSSCNDLPNSSESILRAQSTTAKSKSFANTTSSSSSLRFPLGTTIASNNHSENREHGVKGGGGGKLHHSNRKKFWKVSTIGSGGAVKLTSFPANSGSANSNGSLNSNNSDLTGISSSEGVPTDSNLITSSASPKITNQSKSSNNKSQKYQPQSQLQYPETWKKPTSMTTSVLSSATSTATKNDHSEIKGNMTPVADKNTVTSAPSTNSSNTTTKNATHGLTSGVICKDLTRCKEKLTSDASTTTERVVSDVEVQPTQLSKQPLRVVPLSSNESNSLAESGGNVNRNYPEGMPSYTLDFLYSVGKRMLVDSVGSTPAGSNITAPIQHRSNRYTSYNNNGYGNHNHHHHHHPQPQQLTIASFLQKDFFGEIRTVGNRNSASSNNSNNNEYISTENSSHTYNNQTHHQQNRFHSFYNHPPSATHYYRQQGIYQNYGAQNGMVSNPANNAQRYHNSHNSNNSSSVDHPQRLQHPRNQQQRQHPSQEQQFEGGRSNSNNGNLGSTTPSHKHKIRQQSKGQNLQNAPSPSSSTSSLSSLASTASSPVDGNSRHSDGLNKYTLRQNSAMEMLPPKNTPYSVGTNVPNFRHNNYRRHYVGHHFNHHPKQNVLSNGQVMGQHQNMNIFTYAPPSSNGSAMRAPQHMQNLGGNCNATNAIRSESSSRACSPSPLSFSENSTTEPSQLMFPGVPNRYFHPDQQAFLINSQNIHPTTNCQPIINICKNDGNVVGKHDSKKSELACSEVDDSEYSSIQAESDSSIQRCNSYQNIRPESSLSHSSQSRNSHTPNSTDLAFNPMVQQLQPSAPLHFQEQQYRNAMTPQVGNLPQNAFHEDDFHNQRVIQHQLPGMFLNDQLNALNGHNSNGFPNANNVVYSQSTMTLIPTSGSTTSGMSRASEEESQLMSARSSSSGSDQLKDSTPDILTAVFNEMYDDMADLNRGNSAGTALPPSRLRSVRSQLHQIPPPFMHCPFSQQSIIYSNYLAYLRSTPSNTSSDLNSNTPPDRFMSRSHLVEVKETPPTLLNNSKWDSLSQQIWGKFIEAQQTEETFKLKMSLWRYLYVTIKKTYPRYGLYLVGSTMSGFGADTSDVDMCLVSRSFAFVEQRMEALFNLTVLRECLKKTEDFESFNLIKAKVPILRFHDKSNHFEVDLNFNNSVGIKNTHLLYCYTQLDWRLRPLALIVKLWAQYHDINNAKHMTISSYSLVLMVIHFLQCGVSPPVLPCLHKMFPEKFTPLRSNEFGHVDMNDNVGPYESKNTQPLGELFLNFLEYYSSFDYRQNAISIRTGGLLPVNVCRQAKSEKNDIHQWKELCIEEPFDLTNTARSVYDFETFEHVKAVFTTSFHILQKTLQLNSIFAPLGLPRLPIRARIYIKRTSVPNSFLISKVLYKDHFQKNLINSNEKSIDFCNEQKSNALSDDQTHVEYKTGRSGATPTTAL